MPGTAKKRWAILAEVIKKQATEQERAGTKRSFSSYSLLTWGPEDCEGWRTVSHASSHASSHGGLDDDSQARLQAEVRLAPASPSLTQLVGFNNTGNVCVWPSEECLAVYCLAHSSSYSGLRVLELGGGMTGLAGLLLAATGQPDTVTLTDGNLASAESLQAVVSRNTSLASSLAAASLRWDDKEAVEERRGQFDLILCADCVFFTSNLAEAMAALLAPGGRALVMAPGREGTFDKFSREAGRHFGRVEEVEEYSSSVWKAHEACLGLEEYTPDIHYPRLLVLSKL